MHPKIEEGERLFTVGRLTEAAECFESVLPNEPERGRALNNLGVIAFEQKDGNLAADYFMQSIKLDPTYTDPVTNLCSLLKASGHLREALPILESLVEKYPDNTEINELLVQAGGVHRRLTGERLAIVSPFGNKFDEIYRSHFIKENDVRVVQPHNESDLKEALDWASFIWSTWCNEPLVYLSQQKTRVPVVTHIRSYEMLTPHLMQNVRWQNLRGAIFVAGHIREIANEMWANQLGHIPQTTVYNMVELDKYPQYDHRPGKNICYVGYLNHKKGIPLLLQCLRSAVDFDPAYTLHVAGTFQETRFEVYWRHLVAEMGLQDNVVMHGWVRDVPALLAEMQYVISTSPWEGCPNNVIEAMACGVRPLVHNWRGAAQLFSAELVFSSVNDFLAQLTSSNYRSADYRTWVEARFNAARNMRQIDAFLARFSNRQPAPAPVPALKDLKATPPINTPPKPVAAQVDQAEEQDETINFYQPLPSMIEIVDNRKAFTVDFCRHKRVLHIGCVDAGHMQSRIKAGSFLHYGIAKVADSLIGADIDESGLKVLREAGYEMHKLDLQTDGDLLRELSQRSDVIVIPEVIEHLDNVGLALGNLKACRYPGEILISTPNAFSYRTREVLNDGMELVHPDHNYYYSPTVLKTVLQKHGLEIKRLLLYYWPIADEIGKQMTRVLKTSPYQAEGMIAIVRDPDAGSK